MLMYERRFWAWTKELIEWVDLIGKYFCTVFGQTQQGTTIPQA